MQANSVLKRLRSSWRGWILRSAVSLVLASAAAGQASLTVVVRTYQVGGGAPVPGVIVSLIDHRNQRVSSGLTGDAGTARLTAPSAGRYVVRADRIGYVVTTSDTVDVTTGHASINIAMAERRVRLAEVKVTGRTRCDGDPVGGEQTAAVWNEIRKAVTATVITASEPEHRSADTLIVRRYYRRLDLSLRVQRESSEVRVGPLDAPFRSAPARILSREGFVRDVGDEKVYFAPDASVLVSDEFAADHCFRVVRRRTRDSVQVGLEFEPVLGRPQPDVAGTLWLDERSAELQYLEYRYRHLPDGLSDSRVGGRIEFARLKGGRWIVSRWFVRAPLLGRFGRQQVGVLDVASRTDLIGYYEEGGLVSAESGNQALTLGAVRTPVLRGMVYDSVAGEPLVGAVVELRGVSGLADTTSHDGTFELRSPLSGDYTVIARHERIALLGIGNVEQTMTLRPGDSVWVDLAIPAEPTVTRKRCAAVDIAKDRSLLIGWVRDSSSGSKIPGASVVVSWETPVLIKRGTVVEVGERSGTADLQADGNGAYAACGVPRQTEVRLLAAVDGLHGQNTTRIRRDEALAHADILLSAVTKGRGLIDGTVTAAGSEEPIRNAEIELAGTGRSIRTDIRGRFSAGELAARHYHLVVRALGYVPARRDIRLGEGDTLRMSLTLSQSGRALDTIIISGKAAERGRLIEFERRRIQNAGVGRFISPEQLASQRNRKLSDVLRTTTAGIELVRLSSGGTAVATGRGSGAVNSNAARVCFMQVFVDGARLFSPSAVGPSIAPPNIDDFGLEDVAAVEVYLGPAQTPVEFGGSEAACGAIVLWTREK